MLYLCAFSSQSCSTLKLSAPACTPLHYIPTSQSPPFCANSLVKLSLVSCSTIASLLHLCLSNMKNISVVMCFLGVIFVEFLLVYAHGSNLVHNKHDGAVEAKDLDATTDLKGRRLDQVIRDGHGQKGFDFAGGVERHDGGHGSSSGGGKGQRGGGEQTVRPKNDERSGAISDVLEQLVHVGVGLILLAVAIFDHLL